MDYGFWQGVWTSGRTAFHQSDFHPQLLKYFPRLDVQSGRHILVPLCGKSLDLLWLSSQGLTVDGVEFHEQAVLDFFAEHATEKPQPTREGAFTRYEQAGLSLYCGDFFQLDKTKQYDLIYDRAALVALPQSKRQDYAKVCAHALKAGGKCLLVAYEYDQALMEGPPFSVAAREVDALYRQYFTIEELDRQDVVRDSSRLAKLPAAKEVVYLLTKLPH